MPKTLIRPVYQNLLNDISTIYTQSKLQARNELNKILTKAYWEIGKRIVTVEQDNDFRAQYGDKLLRRLSEDLTEKHGDGFSLRNLYRMRRFYETHQKLPPVAKLEWSKQCILLSIKYNNIRDKYEQLALKENWSRAKLIKALKEDAALTPPKTRIIQKNQKALKPQRGTLSIYQIITSNTIEPPNNCVLIDCGFNVWKIIPRGGLNPEQMVKTRREMSFTYKARTQEIIDGDTLWAVIDLGFNNYTRQKLRLRGIDAPEIKTTAGKRAKRFVEKALKEVEYFLIRTSKSDKYDRYLADIFYGKNETYLNQQLLDEGFAVSYKE